MMKMLMVMRSFFSLFFKLGERNDDMVVQWVKHAPHTKKAPVVWRFHDLPVPAWVFSRCSSFLLETLNGVGVCLCLFSVMD